LTGDPTRRAAILMAWLAMDPAGRTVIDLATMPDFKRSSGWTRVGISPPVGASLADPVVFRWGAEIRVYVIERWTSGRSAVAYVASPDHGRTWSDPVGVPIAAPGRAAPAHLTGLTVCKSRDGTIPILLLGAFDPARRAWALMAVPEMA
jgi:hypothetical protein